MHGLSRFDRLYSRLYMLVSIRSITISSVRLLTWITSLRHAM